MIVVWKMPSVIDIVFYPSVCDLVFCNSQDAHILLYLFFNKN